MANGPLAGKVALITGAGSNPGMGRIIALAMVRAGARVAMSDVNAGYGIPLEYARENRDAGLAGLAAQNDRMRAQSSQLSPLLSLLGQFA